jgi:cobalt transporter subunit CbtA
MMFRNLLIAALIVGTIVGTVYGVFQHLFISPIIYAAEGYEVEGEKNASETATHSDSAAGSHSAAEHSHNHGHDDDAWAPEDGAERIASTIIADILIGVGFALLLIAAMVLHNMRSSKPKVRWSHGIFWGIAMMFAFFIAPALLGLHPEIPGTVSAPLYLRQGWWLTCVIASITGLLLIYYAPWLFKLAGLLLIAIPHILGAPHPENPGFENTSSIAIDRLSDLTSQFITFTSIGMLIFFLLLGGLSGFASRRISQ